MPTPMLTRRTFSRLAAGAATLVARPALGQGQPPAPSGPVAGAVDVEMANHSTPVLCAEKDNVDLRLRHAGLRSFRVQAIHPSYIGGIVADSYAADWTNCDFRGDPAFKAPEPRRVTIYEDEWLWIVGYAYPAFWRPAAVPVIIGDRRETGLHLVQVWVRRDERAEEVAVVYPPDGYWRIRPLPPAHLKWVAYGSSFLAGPIEEQGRPIVAFDEVRFDPRTMTFTTTFKRGGAARLTVGTLDRNRLGLDVRFDGTAGDLPFAALRSMYVTEFNNDVARVAIRATGAERWLEQPIMDFRSGRGVELWAGRHGYSRHNTSSPDMVFDRFSVAEA